MSPVSKRASLPILSFIAALLFAGCGLLQEAEAPSGTPEASLPAAGDESAVVDEEAGNASGQAESDPAGGAVRFQIDPAGSEARFVIDEVLRGQDNTVVGVTDQVFGEIDLNFVDPGAVRVGMVQVNARTLVTGNNLRNRAINNWILETGDYEFISFAPAAISGLPDSVTFGQAYTLEIAGELTIRDVTQEATFQAIITPISEDRLEGSASTIILRSDYNLTIPSVPQVAGVDDEVTLEIAFAAVSTG